MCICHKVKYFIADTQIISDVHAFDNVACCVILCFFKGDTQEMRHLLGRKRHYNIIKRHFCMKKVAL